MSCDKTYEVNILSGLCNPVCFDAPSSDQDQTPKCPEMTSVLTLAVSTQKGALLHLQCPTMFFLRFTTTPLIVSGPFPWTQT